jgi:adenylosuccinate lyase
LCDNQGTTGTQASFLELFNGDHGKVRELDRRVTQMMGFRKSLGVSGQTYTRKIDYQVGPLCTARSALHAS